MVHNYENRIKRVRGETSQDSSENAHDQLRDQHRELLNQWDDQLQLDGKTMATRVNYLEMLSSFLREVDKPVEDIGKKEVNSYLAEKSSLRTYKATARQFFLWYYKDYRQVSDDEVPRFVDSQLKVTHSTKSKVDPEDVPKKSEVEALMQTAFNHRDRALIAVLADKGMRISEALRLDIKDVYFDEAGIYLMVPTAKKGYDDYRKNRLTFSRPALKDWLESHPLSGDDDAPLFVNKQCRYECTDCGSTGEHGDECSECGGETREYWPRFKYDAARAMLDKLMKRAGLPEERRERLSLHKFRHYSTTKDRQKKHLRDSYIVEDKGWDDPSMLEKYDHLTEDTVDKAHIRQMVEDGQLDKSVLEEMENGNGDGEEELELIRCPNCGEANSPERDLCDQCNQPFTEEAGEKEEKLHKAIRQVVEEEGLEEALMEKMER